MRVIHISDLHARRTVDGDQSEIVEKLLVDIEQMEERGRIDLVVFSGDLAFDGQLDSLEHARALLLDPLRTLIPGRPIALIAGNHDVDRSKISRIVEAGLRETLVTRDAVHEILESPNDLEQALARLTDWRSFEDAWDVGAEEVFRGPLSRVYAFEAGSVSVGVACLSSSWRAQGGDEDHGRLLVGDRPLRDALQAVAACDVRIVAVHHPLNWLAGFDATQVRAQLESAGVFVLTGHEHSPDPVLEFSTRGAALYSRAGCLYESHEYSNSYTVLDLDPAARSVGVAVRRWWPIRREFDVATDLANGGQALLPWPSRKAALPERRAALGDVLAPIVELAHTQSVLSERADHLESPTVGDLLIAPRFRPVPNESEVAKSGTDLEGTREIDPVEALHTNRVVLVTGPPFSGVTGSLLWLLDRHFQMVGTHLPAYVQIDARISIGRLNDAVDLALARAGEPVDSESPVLLAIDDAKPSDSRALGRLIRFLRDRPQVSLLVGSHGDAHAGIATALRELEITHERVFLGPFGRRELRELVRHMLGANSRDVVDRVLQVVNEQRLPRNPLNIAALVFVLAREPELTTINESGLLQSYVDVLLENPTAVDPEGLAMDPRRREHLLQRLAERLVRKHRDRLTRPESEQFVLDYFSALGWRAGSAGHLIDSLIRRRVLVEDDRGVGFRYRALLHLFAAKCALEDLEFATHVLGDPIGNSMIVRHAAGLRRDDAELLAGIAQLASTALLNGPVGVSVEQFDLISDEHGWSRVADLGRVRELLEPPPPPPTEEQLDQIYDELASPSEDVEVETAIADAEPTPFQRIESSARLLAAVLQNSELVADIDLKADVLKTVISGWSIGTVVLAVQEDQIGTLRELLESVIEENDPARRRSLAEHVSRLLVVSVMTVTLYLDAGSTHLQGVLDKVLDDEQFMSQTAHALFATMLYAMLELPRWPERLASLYRNHGRHPIVSEMIRAWALSQYHKEALQRRDEATLEEVIVNLITPDRPTGLNVAQRSAQKSEILENLRRGRLQKRATGTSVPSDEEVEAALE
jgi:predicted phosphodiesterase